MALTKTTLAAAIKASDLILSITNTTTGFPVVGTVAASQPMLVDNELMFITGVPVAGTVVVRGRGSDGTPAIAHDINAPVVTSSAPSDFPAVPPALLVTHPPELPDQITYGQSGAILVPIKDTKVFLASPTAQTMTLAPPSLASTGVEIFISSDTAQAHVISAPLLFNTGAVGSPFSTATFPAALGASLLLMMQNGLYNVIAVNGAIVFT